jgi:hypothetical protein
MMPEVVTRHYNGSDALMTQTARITYGLYVLGMPEFTAFDHTLDAAYAVAYLVDLENAETIVRDSIVISQQVALSENVQTILDIARSKYKEIKYFVEKAFPESFATRIEFGFDDYKKSRRNQLMMGDLLFEMHRVCEKHKTILIAAGYNQSAIDAILTLRDELIQKNTSQKLAQKRRPKLTEDRIIILNTCYKTMMTLMSAAHIVYADDYAKKQQFVYMPSGQNSETD